MKLFDLLFPPSCIVCHESGQILHDHCELSINFESPVRFIDGLPLFSAMVLNNSSRSIVLELKENRSHDACDYITAVMNEFLESIAHHLEVDEMTLLCLPSPRKNRFRRGFSHMKLISNNLARTPHSQFRNNGINSELHISIAEFSLNYDRKVSEQRGLSAQERHENLDHSMRVVYSRHISSLGAISHFAENVILLDDVITTGSTMREAARALKEKNIHPLCGVSFAATPYLLSN